MASSSDEGLDESIPEMVYQYISLTDAISYKREDSYLKCQLCNQFKKHFYCVDCIRNGNFTHSKTNFFERFADKKPKKYKLDEEKNNLLKKYEAILSRKAEAENVRLDIERHKEKIKLLEEGIRACKAEMTKDKKLIEDLKDKKHRSIKRQKEFSDKLVKLQKFNESISFDVERKKSKLALKQSALNSLLEKRVKELVTYIFPISKVPSSFYKDSGSMEIKKKAELQEAQTFTYVEGNWTYDNPSENVYSIVEPFLITGDYSALVNWSEKMEFPTCTANLSNDDSDHYNPVHVSNAALAYEAQLVNTITYIMDCHVPKRTCFNDFCKYENLEKLIHCIAKLNSNILNLCIVKQVDLTVLRPNRTMPNLLALIYPETNKEEKSITPEEKEKLIKFLEDSISVDLLLINDSDDDNSDDLEAEFVHVSDEDVPDSLPTPVPVPEPVPIHTSLLSSLWKAATGQK